MIVLSDPDVTITLRRSRSARRISLTVPHTGRAPRATAPLGCPRDAVLAFIDGHRDWLRAALARAPATVPIAAGATLPFRGRRLMVAHDGSRRGVRPDFDAGRLDVGGPEVGIDRRVAAWLKEEARAWLLARAGVHAAQLGARFERIAIRDTTSRWGSCSASGALSFSWRLILAPDAVSDYVAAHEVAHLREMNHSARFWALVERLRPDWRAQRDWLRAHGADLHRYQVAPPRLIRSDVA